MAPQPDVDRAHLHAIRHRCEIMASDVCGCFYCLRTFVPHDIEHWLNGPTEADETALCPYCCIDSVLGSASGFPISADFLRRMHAQWFDTTVALNPEPAE